jgi:hypothetical protein
MTGEESLALANGVLKSVLQEPLSVPRLTGTEKEKVEAVLRAYVARLRKTVPRFASVEEDWMLPDIVVQRLREELGKMK